jgi:hypothetical protein
MQVVVFPTKPKTEKELWRGVSVLEKAPKPLKPKFCSCSKPESSKRREEPKEFP